ncbi:MAG: J domain-containing protein [Bryobacteraceae bacterium]|jgi:curved DNA-binding protein CbpA
MIASHRADEITFYEELGVAPGASSEEIRDAFRALVRLLHPDQQTDAQLKDIAEKQMRKLNRIYAVLSDPERRRQYDGFLDDEEGPPAAVDSTFRPGLTKVVGRVAWVVAILVSAGLLIWLASETTPAPQSRAREQNAPVATTATPASKSAGSAADQEFLIAGLRSDLSAVTRERDAAIRELTRLRGTAGAPQSASSALPEIRIPPITMTELPSTAKLPVFANFPGSRTEGSATHKLIGFWFYAKPPQGQQNQSQGRYPPEYIEAAISEENGTIHGKYRARFQVVDRAISPDVNFTFTGASGAGPQATFPWTGSGGAKGELTLRFLSENSLRINWKASELGTEQGLDADTAILTRRIQ